MSDWFKARKKPVIVKVREVEPEEEFWDEETESIVNGETISTREGEMRAVYNRDYIICGVQGEIYPIKKDIFNLTYDCCPEGS